MPRIRLKPGSAEFADETHRQPHTRVCDMPGCRECGEYKAPRDRSLAGHYWFCLLHVQEYNKAWDFFSGMSAAEIEEQIVRSTLWDRPTRRYDTEAAMAEKLRTQAWQTYHFTDNEPPKDHTRHVLDYLDIRSASSVWNDPVSAKYQKLGLITLDHRNPTQ